LNQTYQNWQYILVDNQSTDDSGRIAASYAARFPRKVRLIRTNSFLAQVPNYNFALTQISPASKYTKMVQADDWIYPECLEKLVALAESDPSIGMVSSHYLRGNHRESYVEGHGLPYSKTVMTGAEICRLQLGSDVYAFGSPTVLLYRSEVVRSCVPFYDETTPYDDTDAHYRTMQHWSFGFVHQVLSCLRVREGSIRMSIRAPQILDRFLQVSKFGPVYFEGEELDELRGGAKHQYYACLAHHLLSGSNAAFWGFHVSALKSSGLRIENWRLLKYTCLEIARLLTNPGSTAMRIYERLCTVKNGRTA
jgi:glycosyltransferase involved in cell wall biosynthesis